MLDNLTLTQVIVVIGALYGVIKGIDSLYDIYKKHSLKDSIHKELKDTKDELNKKIEFHSELLDKDKKHFERVDDDINKIKNDYIDIKNQSDKQFSIMVKTLLALVSYELDSSNKDDLREAQKELLSYLADN